LAAFKKIDQGFGRELDGSHIVRISLLRDEASDNLTFLESRAQTSCRAAKGHFTGLIAAFHKAKEEQATRHSVRYTLINPYLIVDQTLT
jgi:hypothetical protein